jgi:hypothetical protein
MVSRREFIGNAGRVAAIAALGVLGVYLGRKAAISRAGYGCIGRGECRKCARIEVCPMPLAGTVRERIREEKKR